MLIKFYILSAFVTFSILGGQAATHKASGACSEYFNPQEIEKWLNSEYKSIFANGKVKTRKDILKENQNTSFGVFMKKVNPEFFENYDYGKIEDYTKALIYFYKQNNTPKEDYILPGAIFYKKGRTPKFVQYRDFEKTKIPDGYEKLSGNLPDDLYLRALQKNVIPFEYNMEMEKKFDIYFVHHDIGHMASLINKDYLQGLKKVLNYIVDKKKNLGNSFDLGARLLNRGGIGDFFESYYLFKKNSKEKFNAFLNKYGFEGLESVSHEKINMILTETDALLEIEKYKFGRMGVDEYKKKKDYYENVVSDLIQFIHDSFEPLGGSVNDQLSYHHPYFARPGSLEILNSLAKLQTAISQSEVERVNYFEIDYFSKNLAIVLNIYLNKIDKSLYDDVEEIIQNIETNLKKNHNYFKN